MVYGLWSMVYGLWSMVYGLWTMVYGLWSMVYGLWSMVYGLWSMVYGLWSIEAYLLSEAKVPKQTFPIYRISLSVLQILHSLYPSGYFFLKDQLKDQIKILHPFHFVNISI